MVKHASIVLEDEFRNFIKAQKYWENPTKNFSGLEFDAITKTADQDKLLIYEIKWKDLSSSKKNQIKDDLEKRFLKSQLYNKHKFKLADIHVLGFSDVVSTFQDII